jgi:hypothetical protein
MIDVKRCSPGKPKVNKMSRQDEHGQVHLRKVIDQLYQASNATINDISDIGESLVFCRNPAEYEWKYIGRRELIVPYHCVDLPSDIPTDVVRSSPSNAVTVRYEQHRVWIVDGTLKRGESNLLTRRRFYLDEESWLILLGEAYDIRGELVQCYVLYSFTGTDNSLTGRWCLA